MPSKYQVLRALHVPIHIYMYMYALGKSALEAKCLTSEVELREQKSKSTCGSRGKPASGRADMCCIPCYYINSKYPSTSFFYTNDICSNVQC